MSVAWVPRIGADFAGYRLESLTGHGGMSVVYRAEHLSLGRTVALKLLAPQLSEDEAFRERFLRESRLAAGLDHPNIIPIYEAGEQDGVFFIAMRYVDGLDLKTLLKREGALDGARTASVIGQVASALEAAHAKGLVHRDVKPANILIASGLGVEGADHVYLSDFGVVKHGASRPLTQTGMFVGTAEYASPEQIEGKPLDGRADVYSLSCVLYECLTGNPAYDKDSEVALMYAHLLEPPPSVTEKRPDLPPEIDQVLNRGMAKVRDERYQTPSELAAATRQALLGEAARPATAAGATQLSAPAETVLAGAAPPPAGGTSATAPPPAPPPVEAAPAPPSAPPPSGPGLSRRAKIAIIAAVVALLAAGGAVAAVLLAGGDDDGGGGGTAAGGTRTAQAEEASLLSVMMPTQIGDACTTQTTAVSGAVETESCSPPEGAPTSFPNELTLSFFPNASSLEKAYADAKKGVTVGNCGAIAGERVWIHLTTGQRGGRRFCYIDNAGESVIVWTHEKLGSDDHVDMLGIAREPGRAPTLFQSWWNAANDNIGKCRPLVSEDVCVSTVQTAARKQS